MICDEVERNERAPEVVEIKVQSGFGHMRLYAVVDRRLLDYRTPFLGHRAGAGTFELSTLNAQLAVPSELRFMAYTSIDGLPEPQRSAAKSRVVRLVRPTEPSASASASESKTAKQKSPRPAVKIQILVKRKPDAGPSNEQPRRPFVLRPPAAPAPKAAAADAAPIHKPAEVVTGEPSAYGIAQLAARGASKQELFQQRLLHKIKMAKMRGK